MGLTNDRPERGGVMELKLVALMLLLLGIYGQLKGDVEWTWAVLVVGWTMFVVVWGCELVRRIKCNNDRP